MLSPVRIAAPTEAVLSLPEAKRHLRVDDEDVEEDDLIKAYVAAATQYLDGWGGVLGQALVTQTWRVDARLWPCGVWRLPLGPVQQIVSVNYRDAANAPQTLDAGGYALFADALGPYVEWSRSLSLPALYDRGDAASVSFIAGYGGAAAVPENVKQIVRFLVGHWFNSREAVNVGNIVSKIPMAADALIAAAKSYSF
jgi:uncharacterized phiE125 gp8 family phage protein